LLWSLKIVWSSEQNDDSGSGAPEKCDRVLEPHFLCSGALELCLFHARALEPLTLWGLLKWSCIFNKLQRSVTWTWWLVVAVRPFTGGRFRGEAMPVFLSILKKVSNPTPNH